MSVSWLAVASSQAAGTIVAWGDNSNALRLTLNAVAIPRGTVSTVPANATNLVAIAAGDTHKLGLKGDGVVIGWGDSSLGKTAIPADLTNAIALAAGRFHSLALRSDG